MPLSSGRLMIRHFLPSFVLGLLFASSVHADPPVASYVFPAGGKRGETVQVKIGGLNLHSSCGAEMLGTGVTITPRLERTRTLWFEGPLLPLPESQRAEDYPKDMAGKVTIQADAAIGMRAVRLWTSQGATPHLKFLVGDLPEVVEDEIDGEPIPVQVSLPVTINGRIFPRADVDVWAFTGKKGQPVTLEVHALRLGSPLEARLEIRDAHGKRMLESDLPTITQDVRLRFVPPRDGPYSVMIHDLNNSGGQSHVYRLTLNDGSVVDRVYPLGGKKGTTIAVEAVGQGIAVKEKLSLLRQTGVSLLQLERGGRKTNSFLFDVDELEEVSRKETSGPDTAPPVNVPSVCNGRILSPGAIHDWQVKGKKGETLELELRAARLGSPLDGVLTITDDKGKELARAEAGADGDPSLRFTVPADGLYSIRVQDRFRSRGGPEYAYRLRITSPAPPDFRLSFKTDGITLPRAGQVKLPISVERRGGFSEAISLSIDGLPKGVSFSPTTIAAKQNAVDVTFKAEKVVSIGPARLILKGTAKIDGKEATRKGEIIIPAGGLTIDKVLLGVALPTPFKIKGEYDMRWASRGGWFERKYQVERTGYEGPITVSLADKQARHLQGVSGGTILVAAGANEFTYPVQLPPWMETGRTSRTCVMGVAKIKDNDGSEHEVSFTSVQQNEQLVAVVEPARLGLSLDRTSIRADADTKAVVRFNISRGLKLDGAAKVEVVAPAHFRGIKADPVKVAADKQEGQLTIIFEKNASPWNMPLTIRASIMEEGRPVIAEAKLELVRDEK